MRNLESIRSEIDGIDDQIAALIRRRTELADEVAAAKRESGRRIGDPARERNIMTRVTENADPASERALRQVFSTLFGMSRARQRERLIGETALSREIDAAVRDEFPRRAVVACAGTEGSFAQQATSLIFPVPTILYFNGFEKVFEAVESGLCPYGILPVENSAAGSVSAVYDLMQRHRFHIVRSLRLKVDHALLALPGVKIQDVREITSHPHALTQCSQFLKAHPDIRTVPASNTATAAKAIAEGGRRDVAVIASRRCAELYGLEILREQVADAAFNYTRFICIAKDLAVYPDAGKITLMLGLPHRPGSLNQIIAKFAAVDVNLTKLESRPLPGQDFEFNFIFDFEASLNNSSVRSLLSELSTDPEIERFTVLGAYAEK